MLSSFLVNRVMGAWVHHTTPHHTASAQQHHPAPHCCRPALHNTAQHCTALPRTLCCAGKMSVRRDIILSDSATLNDVSAFLGVRTPAQLAQSVFELYTRLRLQHAVIVDVLPDLTNVVEYGRFVYVIKIVPSR